MKASNLFRVFICMLMPFLLGGCGKIQYLVDIVNYGRSGVLILQVGERHPIGLHNYYSKVGVTFPIIIGRSPSIPSDYRDPAKTFGYFQGHEDSLPEEVEVVWQLADLKDCDDEGPAEADQTIAWMKANGYDPAYHVRKSGCTWVPLPDKIFRKKLDLRPIRESEAYKKAGQRSQWIAGSRYRLNITLIFNEDQVTIKTENYATNPWK